MNKRSREGFYALWTASILLCLALCIAVLVYVSFFASGKSDGTTAPPAAVQAEPTAPGEDALPGEASGEP